MAAPAAGVFGSAFETILPMTNTLTMTANQANTNLVYGLSGLGGGKVLTLPSISAMVGSQNYYIQVSNKSDSGGTITVAAASGDSIIGATTVAAGAVGVRFFHDGLHSWFPA